MTLKEMEKICPICGKPNNCQHGQGNCWCENVSIPEYILDLVPEDKKGKVCICKDCINKYTKE
ncbi:cysteine-rich CWC family protein [Schnuerera sp.]|uniref:cysteine-rich CWC family protein n=1 Tax=Schnuerera sp. TaxID=2794844 RepID=UPI002B6EAE81|nr:cysteine-rich CWC family protein [Schnuerera sp.]HSH35993.1 cysteine-rich CWC family protein [Schnuerera sp.]